MITADELRAALSYDQETGVFVWRDRPRSAFKNAQGYGAWKSICGAGAIAGSPSGHGYRRISIDGDSYLAHRLAWLYVNGSWPSGDIDHINGNGDDNRIANLRDIPSGENQRNMKRSRTNTSGVTGVQLTKYGTWRACIWRGNKYVNLGSFQDKECAVNARKSAEVVLGYHPNHGRAA